MVEIPKVLVSIVFDRWGLFELSLVGAYDGVIGLRLAYRNAIIVERADMPKTGFFGIVHLVAPFEFLKLLF